MSRYLFTAIGLSPGGSGYFTCKQNMKLVTTKFKSGGLNEKHVVATWNVGNHLSICFWAQGNRENLCRDIHLLQLGCYPVVVVILLVNKT